MVAPLQLRGSTLEINAIVGMKHEWIDGDEISGEFHIHAAAALRSQEADLRSRGRGIGNDDGDDYTLVVEVDLRPGGVALRS